jgi:ABC-type iron transport system FetAB permease component
VKVFTKTTTCRLKLVKRHMLGYNLAMIFGLPIWQYTLSQVLGALMLAATVWALQSKSKTRTLLITR